MVNATFGASDASDHVRLLRKAARTKLALLGLLLLVTWGLWTTLQAGDQKASTVDATYDVRLVGLKKKWNISTSSPIGYESETIDIIQALVAEKVDLRQMVEFEQELDALRGEYYNELGNAYSVHFKPPYLEESITVNGLGLADWWPFVFTVTLAAVLILSMRERVNAIMIAWMSQKTKDGAAKEDLIIRSDFRVVAGGVQTGPTNRCA
jgi:hypothetical protein